MQEKIDKVFHPSTKNVGQCYICKDWMAGSKLECDHVVGEVSCVDYLTAEQFLWHCAGTVSTRVHGSVCLGLVGWRWS